jgi:hypothetical protein
MCSGSIFKYKKKTVKKTVFFYQNKLICLSFQTPAYIPQEH